jgi:gamma-glutamyl-gamma-aminobutyrate hydrolase PuuD
MGRPIIGITGELEAARWGNWIREAVVSPVSYTRAVERAGGTPVILPPVPAGSVPVLIAGLSGLVLTGGRDIDPSLYDEAPHEQTDIPDHRRDRFELILTRAAIDADLPFLAIGRGMHILNVARGGTITQHLPDRIGNESHKPDPVKMTTHDLQIVAASKLGGVLGETAQVPAAHHQAINRIGTDLLTVAWTQDQVVEALEVQGHRWGLGVQWNPAVRGADRGVQDRRAGRRPGPVRGKHPLETQAPRRPLLLSSPGSLKPASLPGLVASARQPCMRGRTGGWPRSSRGGAGSCRPRRLSGSVAR